MGAEHEQGGWVDERNLYWWEKIGTDLGMKVLGYGDSVNDIQR